MVLLCNINFVLYCTGLKRNMIIDYHYMIYYDHLFIFIDFISLKVILEKKEEGMREFQINWQGTLW